MKQIVTLNIESTEIRFLVSDGKRIIRWGSVPLPSGVIREGAIVDAQALNLALTQLITSQDLKKARVAVSLNGVQSVHRTVILPRMAGKLLEDAIQIEAKKAMPISLNHIHLSWQIVSPKKDEAQQFFLLGVPRNILDSEIACLRQAGLDPTFVNLKTAALAKMIGRAHVLIIDIEPESCTIAVIAAGLPAIMHNVVLNRDLSSPDRAQQVLQEFERTLQFYESNYTDHPLTPDTALFFTGSLATDTELSQILAAKAGYKLEPLTSPLRHADDFPLAQYAVNVGLALKKRPAASGEFLLTDLNVLPEIYRPKSVSPRQILFAAGAVAGIALLIPLYTLVSSAAGDVRQLRGESDQLQQQITAQQTVKKQTDKQIEQARLAMTDIKGRIQKIETITIFVGDIQTSRSQIYQALDIAVNQLPSGLAEIINLSSVKIETNEMALSGETVGTSMPVKFGVTLKIKPNAPTEVGSTNANEMLKTSASLDDGYRAVLDYANYLKGKAEWFSDVWLGSMNSSAYTSNTASQVTYTHNPPAGEGTGDAGEMVYTSNGFSSIGSAGGTSGTTDPSAFPGGIPQSGPSFLNSMGFQQGQ